MSKKTKQSTRGKQSPAINSSGDGNVSVTYSASPPSKNQTSGITGWEKIAGFTFGVIFVVVLLVFTAMIPEPTPTQYATFKTVLALAAAGIGGILAGFLKVDGAIQKWTFKAGGALGLFVIVYFFTPAPPKAVEPSKSAETLNQKIEGDNGIQIGVVKEGGVINIGSQPTEASK